MKKLLTITVALLLVVRTVTTGTVEHCYSETTSETNKAEMTTSDNPEYENDLLLFMNSIGLRESSDNYDTISKLGYIGRYQFGKLALSDVGIVPAMYDEFRACPELQDKAFIALCAINKFRLRNYISYYGNKMHNGVLITESGLLAAAHLLGTKNVKKYLRNDPSANTEDYFGTSITEYLELFSGYDMSAIEGQRQVNIVPEVDMEHHFYLDHDEDYLAVF